MSVPTNLGHTPIIAVDNYDKLDGQYKHNNTDAKVLSIGLAQWSKDESVKSKKDISVKVFRHNGNRWSPQSEEMPPHRAIDLSILAISSFITSNHSSPITNLQEFAVRSEDSKHIENYYNLNKSELIPKIEELRRIINILLP